MYYELFPCMAALTNTRSINLVLAFAVTSTDLPIPGILHQDVPEMSRRSEDRRGHGTKRFFSTCYVPSSGPGTREHGDGGRMERNETAFLHKKCCLILFNTEDGKSMRK